MYYVPKDNYPCYVIQDSNTIRAYHIKPYNPSYNTSIQIAYTDYYVNSHYMNRDGSQSFNYNSSLPSCLDSSLITSESYYRNDFDSILIIFIIMSIICFYLPLKIFFRLFKRGNF